MKRRALFIILAAATLLSAGRAAAQHRISIKDTLCYVVTDSAAFLNSSYGEDRLGGVKMNFIDSSIVLKATGHTEKLYRVALSQNRSAFIPKDMVHPAEADTTANVAADLEASKSGVPAITSSFSVRNMGKYDQISFRLSSKCAFTIMEEQNPRRITVQLFGAVTNTAWLTHHSGLGSIESVDAQQTDSDIVTMTINLKNGSSWGYNAFYKDNLFTVTVKHTPKLTLKGMVIGLDAGHGGAASGAVSKDGTKEKDLNMNMVYILRGMLEKRGARVVLSRNGDQELTMQRRKEIFRENDVDLLLSVHCNASGPGVRGTSTYYKYLVYRPLAEKIFNRLMEIEGVEEFGLVGNFNFSLAGTSNYPVALVETLFMSDPKDIEMLKDERIQKEMMAKVVKGLEDYLKHCKKLEKR